MIRNRLADYLVTAGRVQGWKTFEAGDLLGTRMLESSGVVMGLVSMVSVVEERTRLGVLCAVAALSTVVDPSLVIIKFASFEVLAALHASNMCMS